MKKIAYLSVNLNLKLEYKIPHMEEKWADLVIHADNQFKKKREKKNVLVRI